MNPHPFLSFTGRAILTIELGNLYVLTQRRLSASLWLTGIASVVLVWWDIVK